MDNLHLLYLEEFDMGNAKFYYYPQPEGASRHLVEIDMGEALGELQSSFEHDTVDAITQSGGIFRSVSKGGEVVTIQRDRMNLGEDLAIIFDGLQNHLDRGYSCMFSSDHAKSWAASCIPSPTGGSFTVDVGDAVFSPITGTTVAGSSIVPVAGDYVVLETDSPPYIREVKKIESISVSAATGGTITFTRRIAFDYTGRMVFCRWYRFFPVLKRASDIGSPIVTNEGGRLFSLSLSLVVDYELLFANYNGNGESIPLTEATPATGDLPNTQGTFSLDTSRGVSVDTRDPRMKVGSPYYSRLID